MGTELIGDWWLQGLTVPEGITSGPARRLLRAQILTYNRTHHLMALNDELPRKRIQHAAKTGHLPKIYVRCMRCGTVAWLSDWIAGAELKYEQRKDRVAQVIAAGQQNRVDFLLQCRGTEYLETLAALTEHAEGKDMP